MLVTSYYANYNFYTFQEIMIVKNMDDLFPLFTARS